MANSNDDRDLKPHKSVIEEDTSGQEICLTTQKYDDIEEKSQSEVVITEILDSNNGTDSKDSLNPTKDTVINIGVSEICPESHHVSRKKLEFWPFNHNRTSKNNYGKGEGQDQKLDLQQEPQGYLKQRFVVLQQFAYAPSEGAPLSYDPESRNDFVLLVMIIVLVMLLCTTAFIATVLSSESLKDFFHSNRMFILVGATIAQLACTYAMMCSACTRRPPCNFVVLTITTISMSLLAALISSYFRTEIVLYAAIATAAVVLVCAGLACTSFDFTKWLLYVIVISVAFAVVVIVIFIGMKVSGTYMKPVHLGILLVSVLIQSVVLVIQLQMILGGRSVELGEDDYALGAFMLYTSIVDVFIKMVQILGLLDDS